MNVKTVWFKNLHYEFARVVPVVTAKHFVYMRTLNIIYNKEMYYFGYGKL